MRPKNTDEVWRLRYPGGATTVTTGTLAAALEVVASPDATVGAWDTDDPNVWWPHDLREPDPDERLWGVQWFTGATEGKRTLAEAEEWVASDLAAVTVVWWDGHIWRDRIPADAITPDEPTNEELADLLDGLVGSSDGLIQAGRKAYHYVSDEALTQIARRLREVES